MTIGTIISNVRFLVLLTLPALTGCVGMGVAGVEAFAVGATATTAAVIAIDAAHKDKDKNVKIYGNYNDENGFWLDKDKFSIFVIADSQYKAERIARKLSREACQQKGRFFSILSMQNERPYSLITRYDTEISFNCTSEMTRSETYSILVTTEDQNNSERLARELANESCKDREEDIAIIDVDNYLRPVSLLVLDAWYATNITFSCVAKTTEAHIINSNEPHSTSDNSINQTENTLLQN